MLPASLRQQLPDVRVAPPRVPNHVVRFAQNILQRRFHVISPQLLTRHRAAHRPANHTPHDHRAAIAQVNHHVRALQQTATHLRILPLRNPRGPFNECLNIRLKTRARSPVRTPMQRVHLRMRNVQEAPQPRRERRLTATARAGNQNTHAPLPLWLVHKSARTPVDTKGGLRPCTSRIHSPPSTATPAQLNARRAHAAQARTPYGAHDQRLEKITPRPSSSA